MVDNLIEQVSIFFEISDYVLVYSIRFICITSHLYQLKLLESSGIYK